MSTTLSQRRRVRRACTPCKQRKRKCDSQFPCGMCTAYEYDCFYGAAAAAASAHASSREAALAPAEARASPEPVSKWRIVHRAEDRGNNSTQGSSGGGSRGASPPPAATATAPGIFDEYKSRYAGASAAMAFPHVLGVAFGADAHEPPKIRSVAWNFGIRPDEASSSSSHAHLSSLITEDELSRFSAVFFSAMAPIADLISAEAYSARCRAYFHPEPDNTNNTSSSSSSVAFSAIAAGVAALGSFLSPSARHPHEAALVLHAKIILDDPRAMRTLSVDHIIAAGFRVFYLRATTRPNNAWIASCTVVHLCEAVGLHREENILKIAGMAAAQALGHSADQLRRLFWIAYAGHQIMSYEYDRSAVMLHGVTCAAVTPKAGSVADQFVALGQVIPGPSSPFQLAEAASTTPVDELCARLRALDELPLNHPFLILTRADLTFCFYRRLYQLKAGIPDAALQLIIRHGTAAMAAAEQLAAQGRLFWNVIGSVFQYTCVLLAMDAPASHAELGKAFATLGTLVRAADTGLTREALSMARHLLGLSTARKRRELALLEGIEASYQETPPPPPPEAQADLVGEMNWGMDWDQFLFEPYLTVFGLDAPL